MGREGGKRRREEEDGKMRRGRGGGEEEEEGEDVRERGMLPLRRSVATGQEGREGSSKGRAG